MTDCTGITNRKEAESTQTKEKKHVDLIHNIGAYSYVSRCKTHLTSVCASSCCETVFWQEKIAPVGCKLEAVLCNGTEHRWLVVKSLAFIAEKNHRCASYAVQIQYSGAMQPP